MSPASDDDIMNEDTLPADPDTRGSQAAQRHYDPDEMGELTVAIVFAIAEAAGVSPTEMKSPPLYTAIDASALEDTLFGPNVADESRQGTATVEFRYTDYLVEVRSDGWIQVFESTDTDLPN